jgi:hypothetical protein
MKKPNKEKIRNWLICEIEHDIIEKQLELNKINEDLLLAVSKDFKIEISSYKERQWCIHIEGLNENYCFFVDKKTGKNQYLKDGW